MGFVEAFNLLGYEVSSPRQDWSSQNADGVCISIWKAELGHDPDRMWCDTRIHGGPLENWQQKRGNRLRIEHLQRVMGELDGWVDVILVSGTPGEGYGDAAAWEPEKRQGKKWRVVWFDESTGHFEVELRR